jgi:glycosyltransferase involved in cell wall biosynthesis
MAKIILGVSSSFCANFLKGQVNFLVKKGFEVILISGPGEEISLLAKLENARLYNINFTKRISPFNDLMNLIRIIRIIRTEKPELVNAGNPKSGFLIMLACWLTRIPNRIFTLHGLLSDTKSGFAEWLITLTEKISCRIAKKVIVVSPSLKEHAIRRKILRPAKGIVIEKGSSNGIDLEYFSRNPETIASAKKLQHDLKLAGNEMIMGFVGRLSKDKGIDLLFAAFNRLKKDYPLIRLLIAGPIERGDPFSRKTWHQLYEDDHVFYLGKLLDIAPVYCLMDFLLLSSFREGFGNVLIEAAAMEVPVIAPDIPGCRDSLKPGYNGELFHSGDIEDLVSVIEKMIRNEEQGNFYRGNGRKFVSENFQREKIWQGQLQIYQQLIGAQDLPTKTEH